MKEEVPSESETTVSFVDMQPVMKEYCFRCHGFEKTEGKLDLTRFLTREDFLDDIERTMSRTGQRIKTDSKLIRAAIQIASKSLNNEQLDLVEIAEKVVREDGRTLSKLLEKEKKEN